MIKIWKKKDIPLKFEPKNDISIGNHSCAVMSKKAKVNNLEKWMQSNTKEERENLL